MPENMTDALKKEIEERKAKEGDFAGKPRYVSGAENGTAGEASGAKKPGADADKPKNQRPKKYRRPEDVMGAGVPYLAAGVLWGALALMLPIYKLGYVVLAGFMAFILGFILHHIRKNQLTQMEPEPEVKSFADEIAEKLYTLNGLIVDRAKQVEKKEVKDCLGSIAITLSKMADEVEHDPDDRTKVRKLANYYGDMLLELIDRYINLQKNADVAPEGENVATSMAKIEDTLYSADTALKKLLDGLFQDDAMMINADIKTLDSLMKLELKERERGNN